MSSRNSLCNAIIGSRFAAMLLLSVIIGGSCAIADDPAGEGSRTWDDRSAIEFVETYCVDCHRGEDAESGLDFGSFDSVDDVAGAIETWNQIAMRVRDRQMPPSDYETPSDDSRASFVAWIKQTIRKAVCDDGISPGAARLRRLNRTEYANTVRDLLGIQINAGHALPADGAGGEGFDNAAETLFISPIYAEKYLDAARSSMEHALADPEDRERIIVATPSESKTPEQAAEEVLAAFLPRAFRRPVGESEVAEYMGLFRAASNQDESYESAVKFALVAAMVSPKFLFLFEQPGEPGEATLVTHHEMASRLSYFLWSSMPDEELMQLADEGKLHDEEVLATQVKRMLRSRIDRRGSRRDSKARGFATSFVEQWLGTRALGREFKPDPSIASSYDSELEGGMKYEPVFFFEELLAENRSLLNLIDSNFTYANRRLARHYGIGGEFREQPKRVELSDRDHRGGLLGMSAVLAVSSLPHRTSPVLRGKWILETLLGTPPPPPPPDVPALEEASETAQPTSLRERLEIHRANPTCASCHDALDPLGFGLENYDVLGRWRKDVDGVPVDASGKLPSGDLFTGPDELKQLLMAQKGLFIQNLTSKLLGYALGRGLSAEDDCVIDSIVEKLEKTDYRAQDLMTEIVKSISFRYKQN